MKKIKKEEKLQTNKELAKKVGMNERTVNSLFDVYGIRTKAGPALKGVSQSVISETAGLPEEQRISLIKKAKEEDFGSRKMRELVKEAKIMVEDRLKNTTELSERVKIPRRRIDSWFDVQNIRKELVGPAKKVSQLKHLLKCLLLAK